MDDFVENGRAVGDGLGEDLEEVALIVSVHQDAQFGQFVNVLVDLSDSVLEHFVVRLGNAEEAQSARLEARDGVNDVVGAHGDVLDACAAEVL